MRFRRTSGTFAIPLLLALFVSMLWMVTTAGTASAQGEMFTVRAVAVDETAETAAAARQAAIAAGHRRAFGRLIERLVPADQMTKVPSLESAQVEAYVLDFSVADERTSAVRYLAELTFRFNAEEVRTLLRQNDVNFAETVSKPVLVLALLATEGESPVLWLAPNPWRDAWAQRPLDDGLVPLLVPLGDLRDLGAIDAASAEAGDAASLSAIAEAYGAGAVLVTQATVSGDLFAGSGRLSVVSKRYEQGQIPATTRESVVQLPDESEQAFFVRAADQVDAALQEVWKRENVLQFGNQRSIVVFVPLDGLTDLLEVRQRIERVAAIQQSSVTSLSRGEAELQLSFVGNEQRLTRALAQRDLFLSLREDSNWELALPGRTRGADAPVLPGLPLPDPQ